MSALRALTYDPPRHPDEVEAPTILIRTAEGRAALLRYAATKKGKSVAKYLPAQFGAM